MPHPALRHLLAIGAVLALGAGCADEDASGGATNAREDGLEAPQARETAEPDPEEDVVDPETLVGDDPAQDPDVPVEELTFDTCEGDGYTIGYPETWNAAADDQGAACAMFGPGGLGAEDSGDLSVPVQVYVDPETSFEEQPEPTEVEQGRQELTVDGQQAVRFEAITRGEGGQPEGVELTTYRVDLGDQGLLTATTSDLGDTSYARDQEILERMIEEMRID